MAVIAVIAILSAILLPTIRGARVTALRAKTRTQFSQWAAGVEQFRQEYGFYPLLIPAGADNGVNHGVSTDPSGAHLFHDVLAGARRDGVPITAAPGGSSAALEQNPRGIRFVSFAENDFVTAADVSAGRAEASQLNHLRDGFHGTSIAVIVDSNLDGLIDGRDAPNGFPLVTVPGTSVKLGPPGLTAGATNGIRASVVFYSAPPDAVSDEDLILSWR